jgi:general secretion pathway protein G
MQHELKTNSVEPSQRKPIGSNKPRSVRCIRVDVSRKKIAPRRAFSLVELMVVMIIIGLLSSLVAVQTRSYLIASKQNAARAEIATMVSALESFYADQSRYPTNDEGIEILTQGTKSFPDGFLKKLPLDPWRNPYEYVSPGANSPFEIVCLGADGREGGEGGDADITSETLDAKPK